MNTAELFASEWQSLREQRQQLLNEADQLKRRLNNHPAEPSIGQLLEEKNQLKKKAVELKNEVEIYKSAIQGRLYALERRRRAVTDKRILQELATILENSRKRLRSYIKSGNLGFLLENQRRMIWEIEAPIAEVQIFYQQENAEEEQKQQAAQRVLDETLEHIAAIEEHYCQTKKCLEEAVRETERRRQQLHEDSLQWATQDRDHLQWTLDHEPSYRDDVIHSYRTKFPLDTLADLLPPPTPRPVQVQNLPKARRKKNRSSPPATPKTTSSEPQSWRFFVTFNADDPGSELPQEHDQFLSNLKSALHKAAYHNLDVQLVYDKLLAVTHMSTQQRQEMNKVVDIEPLGWKILRVGMKHRLFLSIDEDRCVIRFLPRPRKKSYAQH